MSISLSSEDSEFEEKVKEAETTLATLIEDKVITESEEGTDASSISEGEMEEWSTAVSLSTGLVMGFKRNKTR